jgi:uncharacterized protein YceK
MNKINFLALLVLLFAVATVSGCASVAPWERGILAKPQMALDPYPLQSGARMHAYGSREAGASANSEGGGGGCGCY